ncbi:DNA-processing protein DprA [Actinophytocola glycyrrhizae]|uniref:DNA-processing protein DprA n=1 Tax=Actinophytocola glycyrrhizae TaxID=2044873 RepID=A0ABV9S157_9PSEU
MLDIRRLADPWRRQPIQSGQFRLARMDRPWNEDERAALVALLRTRPAKLTWSEITAEIATRGSALALWDELNPAGLFDHTDAPDGPAAALAEAAHDVSRWRAADFGFLTFGDDDYPVQLREIHEMPPVLFHRGTLVPNEVGVSVVGSRQATTRGLDIARSVAAGLAARGITVIAGLARGIDTAAHTATLEAGGRTVAVVGTGITKVYPAENRGLQDRIAREGLVLSQFWPDAPPTKHSFPMRNAVMSGFGRATVVVEAGEHSGARIQARKAVSHGRPVIFTDLVVDTNKWPSELLGRPGVHVAASTAEIMSVVEKIAAGPATVDSLLAAATRR